MSESIPVDSIESSDSKLRPVEAETVSELAKSIESKGLMQPILVRQLLSKKYEVICGEHRLQAFKQLHKKDIPCIVEDADDLEKLELKIIENTNRNNFINPAIEGEIYSRLMNGKYKHLGELSDVIGKSTTHISDRISIHRNLLPKLKQLVGSRLTVNNAIALSKIQDESKQKKLADEIMNVKNYVKWGRGLHNLYVAPKCKCPKCGNKHIIEKEKINVSPE